MPHFSNFSVLFRLAPAEGREREKKRKEKKEKNRIIFPILLNFASNLFLESPPIFQFFRPASAAGRFSRFFWSIFPHKVGFSQIFFPRKVDLRQPQVSQNATYDGGVVAGRVLADLWLPQDEKFSPVEIVIIPTFIPRFPSFTPQFISHRFDLLDVENIVFHNGLSW